MKKALKWLFPALPVGDSRPNLDFIKCTVLGGSLVMIAANGFCIKRYFCDTEMEDCEFYIHKTIVKRVLRFAGKDRIQILNGAFKVGDAVVEQYTRVEGIYPDLSSITDRPFVGCAVEQFGINPDILLLCLKDTPSVPKDGAQLSFSHQNGPIHISFPGFEFDSFIMPLG